MKSNEDTLVASLQIDIWRSGALSVSGSIQDEEWAVAALENAIDAVRSHHRKTNALIIPGHDTGLAR